MKKILIILILLIPLNIYAEEINLLTDKYIVYDETSDKVRLSSNENEKVKIASITKIATTLAAIEENINLSQFVERTDICKTNYRLVGAIFTEESEEDENNDKYVSYTKTPNGQWKYCSGNNVQNSSFNELQNHKGIKALFYTIV